jgi:peptide deformylase
MAVQRIRLFPDPVLARPCLTVRDFGAELDRLVGDLSETMDRSPGVGLAAPQIGVSLRVSVIDVRRNKRALGTSHGRIVLINPILLHGREGRTLREGCLSVPEILGNVRRYEEVVVRTQNVDGSENILKSSGFEALALQHEIDHLDGKLFLDRISNVKTDLFARKQR